MSLYCVVIHFTETKVTCMAFLPTEVQQRGYHRDTLYPADPRQWPTYELQFFTDAATFEEAEAKAKQALLQYVQDSISAREVSA